MSKKNIFGEEGIKKLQALAEEIDTCMFCTGLSSRPIEVSPMTVQEVDEEGDFWFIGSKESEKYHNLMENSAVQLLYSDNDNYRYLSVYGSADMVEDQSRVDKYWSVIMEGWFEKGKKDPKIILIRVKPTDIYYWDTKDMKMVSFAKILWTAITGNPNDTGRQGSIEI